MQMIDVVNNDVDFCCITDFSNNNVYYIYFLEAVMNVGKTCCYSFFFNYVPPVYLKEVN